MKHPLSISLFFISSLFHLVYAQVDKSTDPITKTINKNGKRFIKNKHINSVSIGVYQNGNTYTRHFGEIEKGKGHTPTNETIYEIASVTKTMTGYLVAKAVMENKITLDDDVQKFLGQDYSNLAYADEPIRIKHLLTHTSGLPIFLPISMNKTFENLDRDVPNKYYKIEKNYTKAQFLTDLKNVVITANPGTIYAYSNAGAELIGFILETVYGKSIDELLKDGLLSLNGMDNTGIVLSSSQKEKVIQGYWMSNSIMSLNQLNTLWATAGGIKTTMTDMLRYMKLQLNIDHPIVSESHKILFEANNLLKIAYFWRVSHDKYGTSYNHHGGTSGIQNWLYIFPKYNLGISIMTNQSGPDTPALMNKTIRKIIKDIVGE